MSGLGPPPPAGGWGTGPPPGGPPRPPAIVLVFTITVTGILANALVGPAIPEILDHFAVPDSGAGLFVAAGTLPGIVVAPLIGLLADRYGRRNVVVPCLAAFGVFGLASALAPTFELLILFRLAQGIGSAGLINLAVVLIGDHWQGLDRTRRMGQNTAVLTAALAVLPPLGGLLTELGGWRWSFAPYGIGVVAAALVWGRLAPGPRVETITVSAQLRATGAVARHPIVVGSVAIGFVVFMLIFGLFLTVLPLHLERQFGLGAGARGLVIASPAITATVTALRLGWLRARFGAVRLLQGAAAMLAVGFLLVGLAGALPVLLAGGALYGLGEGVYLTILQDLVTAQAPAEQRGAVVALWVGAARAGQTVGPLAMAGLAGATTTGSAFVAGAVVALGLCGAATGGSRWYAGGVGARPVR